jgi:mannose-6-phosphate isomerase-like protein (cupin superfamily)
MARNQGSTEGFVRPPGGGAPLDGIRVRIKATAADTSGVSSVMEIVSAGAGGPPLHIHRRHDEMFYVLEGEYRFRIGDEVLEAPAGTFCYARRGTPHTYASTGATPGRVLSVVTPGGLEEYVAELDLLYREGASEDAIACLNRAWATEIVGPGLE